MEKLIGLKKIRTAVFISGTGSNFKNLIKDELDLIVIKSNETAP